MKMKQLQPKNGDRAKGKRSMFTRSMLWLFADDTLPCLTAEILDQSKDGDPWEALIARDPSHLLERAVNHRPQIIFLYLPPLLEDDAKALRGLCRTIRTRFVLKDIPVVGFCDSLRDYNALLIDLDVQGYLRQPFTREEFATCCEKVLQGQVYFTRTKVVLP